MTRAGYAIRSARPNELDGLAEVERSASVTYFEALGSGAALPDVMPADDLRRCCAAGLLWVAAAPNDHPVGFLAAQALAGSLLVRELSVARDHQRAGLGRRLMQAAQDHAQGSFPAISLITDRFIPFNAPFYARLGFVELPRDQAPPDLRMLLAEEIAHGFSPERRILMTKPLAALRTPAGGLYPREPRETGA
jgi:GNAT superfamily N-acetyltransferase